MSIRRDWQKWIRDHGAAYSRGLIHYHEAGAETQAPIKSLAARGDVLVIECQIGVKKVINGSAEWVEPRRFEFNLRRDITSPEVIVASGSTSFTSEGRQVELFSHREVAWFVMTQKPIR